MEHRTDWEDILLSGLPAAERDHVVKVIGQTSAEKLAQLRTIGERDIQREDERIRRALEPDVHDDLDDDLNEIG